MRRLPPLLQRLSRVAFTGIVGLMYVGCIASRDAPGKPSNTTNPPSRDAINGTMWGLSAPRRCSARSAASARASWHLW